MRSPRRILPRRGVRCVKTAGERVYLPAFSFRSCNMMLTVNMCHRPQDGICIPIDNRGIYDT